MPKKHEFSIGMNNSSTLTAPTRSEIRFSFSIPCPRISDLARSGARRAVYASALLLTALLSGCSVLDVQLPRPAATAMVIAAIGALLLSFRLLYHEFGGWNGIVNHEQKEG